MVAFTDLKRQMSARGLSLRLTRSGKVQVIGDGELSPELAELIRHHRDRFVCDLNRDARAARREWDTAWQELRFVTSLCPDWRPTTSQTRERDEIMVRFEEALKSGDLAAARAATRDLREWGDRVYMLERTFQWAERTDFTPGDPRPMPDSMVDSPHPRDRLCRSCWFDLRDGDQLFCTHCLRAQWEYRN